MAEDIFYTAWLRQDPNFFYLPMWQGEAYAFQLNFDNPISDPDFDNFKLGLYKNNGELSDRVIDELGTLVKVPVSLIEYNIQCEFTLPVDVVDGFYNLVIYDSTDDTVKAQSNCIAVGTDFNRNKYTTRAIWRNSEDIYNFSYEGNEAFYNKMRLPILCEDIQFEDERQQYRDSTTKNYRNFNSYRSEVHLLQSHYFDQNAHRAISALYNSDEIFINGNFYVPKDNYTVEGNVLSRLTKGTINAYLSKDRTFEETPEPPVPTFGYYLEDVVSTNVRGAFSFRLLTPDYTGFCCRVRRSSDDTMLNIGFIDDYVDKDAILAFVGSSDGYLESWYNQVNGSYSLGMAVAANQMKIVNAGAFILDVGGFVSLSGYGQEFKYMQTPNFAELSGNSTFTVASVHDKIGVEAFASVGKNNGIGADSVFFLCATPHAVGTLKYDPSAGVGALGVTKSITFVDRANTVSFIGKRLANNSVYVSINNDSSNTGTDPDETSFSLSGQFCVGSNYNNEGSGSGSANSINKLLEIIIFSEDLSETNRIASHENQKNYYNIG